MKVYVTSVVYRYPEEDGPGFIAGVYLSEIKANETNNFIPFIPALHCSQCVGRGNKTKDKCRERARLDLDPLNRHPKDVDDWYDIYIEEFDVE